MNKIALFVISHLVIFCCCFSAYAQSSSKVTRLCIKTAEQNYKAELKEASNSRNLEKASCKFGPEIGSCINSCYSDFKVCRQPTVAALDDCRRSCEQVRLATVAAEKTRLGCSPDCQKNSDFQKVSIQAGLDLFSCQNTCRSSESIIAARAACRTVNATCADACKTVTE